MRMTDATTSISTMIGELEENIISANEKYFGINPGSEKIDMEQSILYDTLIGYFKN